MFEKDAEEKERADDTVRHTAVVHPLSVSITSIPLVPAPAATAAAAAVEKKIGQHPAGLKYLTCLKLRRLMKVSAEVHQ